MLPQSDGSFASATLPVPTLHPRSILKRWSAGVTHRPPTILVPWISSFFLATGCAMFQDDTCQRTQQHGVCSPCCQSDPPAGSTPAGSKHPAKPNDIRRDSPHAVDNGGSLRSSPSQGSVGNAVTNVDAGRIRGEEPSPSDDVFGFETTLPDVIKRPVIRYRYGDDNSVTIEFGEPQPSIRSLILSESPSDTLAR